MARRVRTLEVRFGEVLYDLRQGAGLSQEALGYAANLHRTFVSQLERGLKSPSLGTIAALAEALGVSAHEMIRRAEKA